MIAGNTFDMEWANDLAGDANYVFNSEALEFKMVPSSARTIIEMASVLVPKG
jgi:hypothetical protein